MWREGSTSVTCVTHSGRRENDSSRSLDERFAMRLTFARWEVSGDQVPCAGRPAAEKTRGGGASVNDETVGR
jgi:hypothetical protein